VDGTGGTGARFLRDLLLVEWRQKRWVLLGAAAVVIRSVDDRHLLYGVAATSRRMFRRLRTFDAEAPRAAALVAHDRLSPPDPRLIAPSPSNVFWLTDRTAGGSRL
jgi:hypothetical protein